MRDRGSRSRPVIHIQLTVAGDVKCVTLVLVCTLVAIREPLGVRRAHPQYEVPSPWAYSRCEASQVPHTHHLLRKHTDDGAPVRADPAAKRASLSREEGQPTRGVDCERAVCSAEHTTSQLAVVRAAMAHGFCVIRSLNQNGRCRGPKLANGSRRMHRLGLPTAHACTDSVSPLITQSYTLLILILYGYDAQARIMGRGSLAHTPA